MSNTALNAISITVGIFFVFFGSLKLAPIFSEELYRDMRKIFIKSNQAFPFQSLLPDVPGPHAVRRAYGSIEVICGTILAMCPGVMRDVSNCVLIMLMLFNLYEVWILDQGFKEASHSLVFGLLLTCRVVIRIQVWSRDNEICESSEVDNMDETALKMRVADLQRNLKEAKRLAAMQTSFNVCQNSCAIPDCIVTSKSNTNGNLT